MAASGGRRRGQYQQYTPAQLAAAVYDHLHKNLTLEEAAELHQVPVSTVADHARKERKGERVKRAGSPTTLTFAEELAIVSWCLAMAALGFPASKTTVRNKASQIAAKRGKSFRSRSGRAGQKWWIGFRRRWKTQLTIRKPSRATREHSAFTRCELDSWYERLWAVIQEHSIKPEDIWNLDETGLEQKGGRERVLVAAGARHAKATLTELREHVTILSCIRSNGQRLPPLWLFKGKEGADVSARTKRNVMTGCEKGATYARTGERFFVCLFLLLSFRSV